MNRDRLRRIRNWQSSEFYARLVMRPLAILVMLVVADWRWLTPNLVTTLGNLAKFVGVALIAIDHRDHAVAAAIAIHVGLLLDHLDGTIARYRGCGTTFGSFYDKVSDAVTWLAITGVVGWAAYLDTGDARLPIAAIVSAYALLVRGYMKWIIATEQQKATWLETSRRGGRGRSTDAAPVSHDPPTRTARQWAAWFVSSLVRGLAFEEVDLFFWIGLGLVLGRLELLCWVLVVSQTVPLAVMIVKRALQARALDTARLRLVEQERRAA